MTRGHSEHPKPAPSDPGSVRLAPSERPAVRDAAGRMLPLFLAGLALLTAMTGLDLRRFRESRARFVPAEAAAAQVPELTDVPGVRSTRTGEGLSIALSETVLFRSGRADLEPAGRPVLQRVAEAVRNRPGRVRVAGHTDDVPIAHAPFSSNYDLSLARAHAVSRFLVETGALPADRLTAAGFGDARPAFPNDSAESRAANRRVEIVVLTEGTDAHE